MSLFRTDSIKVKQDAAALVLKTNVALIYLKKKKIYVFMMLIYEKRGGKTLRTVLLLLLLNMVSNSRGIILNCTIYRDVFHSRKSLYTSNDFIYLVWYHLVFFCTCHWCTCHCFLLFFLWMTRKKCFIFCTVSVVFLVLKKKQNKGKQGSKKNQKAVRPYVT